MPDESSEEYRIRSLEDDLKQVRKDLYFGNGLPGLTTRMKSVEDALSTMKWYFRAIMVALLGLLGHAIFDIIQRGHGK